jgi:hypothetical protein
VSFRLKYQMGGEFSLPIKSLDAFDDIPVVEFEGLASDRDLTSIEFWPLREAIDDLVKFV